MEQPLFEVLDNETIQKWLEYRADGSLPASPESVEYFLFQQAVKLTDTLVGYRERMMMYSCAMRNVQVKFETLDNEFKIRNRSNPIHSINTRLKSNASVLEKLFRKELKPTLENIEEHIQDIAGVRVICSYIDDIYLLADALTQQDDVILLKKKDYISNPKPNGYRSLHLVVSVPVYFADQKKQMPVEVQIRTIAMDFWASLEHQLKYKHEIPEQQEIVQRLRNCADTISEIDSEMQHIRRKLEMASDRSVENDLLDKLRKLDLPI